MALSKQPIEIPLSKRKLTFGLIGSLIFVVLGILFVLYPDKFITPIMRSATTIFISGFASILFFGACFIYVVKKLSDNSPGLIISDDGIIDNSSGVSGGQILWNDIEDIRVLEIHRQKLIMLQVKNPQDYIDKQTGAFKRKMMALNYKMYGTPLSITANALKINFEELLSILTNNLKTPVTREK